MQIQVPMKSPFRWKLVAILITLMIVPLLTLWVWVQVVAERKWAAMERSVREWTAEAQARDARRPVLSGEPIPGNAWDDYQLALQNVRNWKWGTMLEDIPAARSGFDRKLVERILAIHSPALEHWSRGLRRAESRRPLDWQSVDSPDLTGEIHLAMLLASKARLLLEDGRVPESADLLLGLGLFARDVGHNGFSCHKELTCTLYGFAFDGLMGILQSREVQKTDLERISRGLEILDRTYGREGFDCLNERMRFGLALLRDDPSIAQPPKFAPRSSWRFGFSRRLMMVSAFESIAGWYERAARMQAATWEEEERGTDVTERESAASANPMVKEFYSRHWSDNRYRLAQLRLLRIAAHHRVTGEVLSLDDPFGTVIHHSWDGMRLKVWSVSGDGMDDSGRGRWGPSENFFGRTTIHPEDIVLEIAP